MMNRKHEQADLLVQLGHLWGPLVKVAENPEGWSPDDRARVVTRYFADAERFKTALQAFTVGEPGHDYRFPREKALAAMVAFERGTEWDWHDPRVLADAVMSTQREVLDAVYSIPVPVASAIHVAHTPFTTYCLVKNLCSTARAQVVWMDRYFDSTIFGRYFVDVPRTTGVTLVTYPESAFKGNKDRQRYADFMGVSKLFAQERGPGGYRLLTGDAFHDRWLQCDGAMFALGNSIKELGNDTTFTLSRLDDIPENHREFEQPLARGTEVFGPTRPTHP